MIRSCEDARNKIKIYCQGVKAGDALFEMDPEDIRQAFFHIYYCVNRDNKCGELWYKLNKEEKNSEIRKYIENWTDNPMGWFNITSIALNPNAPD